MEDPFTRDLTKDIKLIDTAASYLVQLNPSLSNHSPDDGIQAYWYLTPRHHIIDIILMLSLHITGWILITLFIRPSTIAQSTPLLKDKRYKFHYIDWILGVLMFGSWLWCIICKSFDGRLQFAILPCHALCFLQLITHFTHGRIQGQLFNYLIYAWYMPALPLFTPDGRGNIYPFEMDCFFIQHWTQVILPIWTLYRQRYPTDTSFSIVNNMTVSTFFSIWCYSVYLPLGIISGRNFHYLLLPPQVGFIKSAGPWYRMLMQPLTYIWQILGFYLTRLLAYSVNYTIGPPHYYSEENKDK